MKHNSVLFFAGPVLILNDTNFCKCPLPCCIQNYILTELNANDVKFISVDRQKIEISKDVYNGTVNSISVVIKPHYTNIKNDPRMVYCMAIVSHI